MFAKLKKEYDRFRAASDFAVLGMLVAAGKSHKEAFALLEQMKRDQAEARRRLIAVCVASAFIIGVFAIAIVHGDVSLFNLVAVFYGAAG